MKIENVEPQLAQKLDNPLKHILQDLKYQVPDNYRSRVSLLDARGRKKRSNASADHWSPESGRIEIRFEPTQPNQTPSASETHDSTGGATSATTKPEERPGGALRSTPHVQPAVADLLKVLIKALDRAESTPGWNFVSLKKFRDEVLPSEPFAPGTFQPADVHWHEAIRDAIERRWVLIGKVPNPKAPQFPVTTIRLNRLMPEVKSVLGQEENADLDFHPVEIKGEPLSATIIRERHR